MLGEILSILLLLAAIGALVIGYPVAFTLGGVGILMAVIGSAAGVLDSILLSSLSSRFYGIMTNEVLVAVPLFVFMGVMLERSRIAEQLLVTMGQLFGPLRGGLGISVVLVGGLLAAATGVVGATVVTMGLLSLPAMQRAGYDNRLASGIICSSGTLGQIIPPSTVLIFVADILQSAHASAQLAMGNLAPDPVSVGDLFIGALLPGAMLVGLYVLWIAGVAVVQPHRCPAVTMDPAERRTLGRRVLGALVPPVVLITAVLGSILLGYATATEAASVGAVGAMLLAAANGRLNRETLRTCCEATLSITAMVFVILIGASVFSLVFRGLGGEEMLEAFLIGLPGETFAAILFVMALMFLLGFFLDTFEIVFIILPIAGPVLLRMGVDPVWLGVMIGINLQTSFLTPPFGFALFYLRGVAPPGVSTGAIYRGVIPFVAIQIAALAFLAAVPQSATWLPDRVFGGPAAPGAAGGEPPPSLIDGMTTSPGRYSDY